jgi:hypothetical protein
MLSTGREYAHFQAFQPKISNHLNRNNENIDKNINGSEYGLPSNNINIEEDQVLNENKTKEETKEEKKENPPPDSKTYFETHSSNQQKESEKNAEQHIHKYSGFTYKEKENGSFKILVKNHQNQSGNFLIIKGNIVFVGNDLVTNTSNINFDLPNHEFYILYFDSGKDEIPIGIIERKPIYNNSNIYKYNIIFILEHLVKNFGIFSPYKQLKRIDCKEQYCNYGNQNIQPILTPTSTPIFPSIAQTPTLPTLIQTPIFSSIPHNSNINYPINIIHILILQYLIIIRL